MSSPVSPTAASPPVASAPMASAETSPTAQCPGPSGQSWGVNPLPGGLPREGGGPSLGTSLPLEVLSLFEEAIQRATQFLGLSMGAIGVVQGGELVFQATVGLANLGLTNPLFRRRRLSLADDLVVATRGQRRCLVLAGEALGAQYPQSELVGSYGLHCYGGIPLFLRGGDCLGVLMVMDVQPQEWTAQRIAFLEMVGRWVVSEYERELLGGAVVPAPATPAQSLPSLAALLSEIHLDLVAQLAQDLRSPLTTMTGIAGMLRREIYGPLTPKQQEYATILQLSTHRLLESVDEMIALSNLGHHWQPLHPSPLDLDMVGQQVIQALTPRANAQQQTLHLTVEPRSRLWLVDSICLKNLIYHLLVSTLFFGVEGVTVRLHGAQRRGGLSLTLWIANPWLGEGLPPTITELRPYLSLDAEQPDTLAQEPVSIPALLESLNQEKAQEEEGAALGGLHRDRLRAILSLTLGRHLAERLGGSLTLQGSTEATYRLVAFLPITPVNAMDS